MRVRSAHGVVTERCCARAVANWSAERGFSCPRFESAWFVFAARPTRTGSAHFRGCERRRATGRDPTNAERVNRAAQRSSKAKAQHKHCARARTTHGRRDAAPRAVDHDHRSKVPRRSRDAAAVEAVDRPRTRRSGYPRPGRRLAARVAAPGGAAPRRRRPADARVARPEPDPRRRSRRFCQTRGRGRRGGSRGRRHDRAPPRRVLRTRGDAAVGSRAPNFESQREGTPPPPRRRLRILRARLRRRRGRDANSRRRLRIRTSEGTGRGTAAGRLADRPKGRIAATPRLAAGSFEGTGVR